MPKITEQTFVGGAKEKISRLGLGPLLDDVRSSVSGFQFPPKEEKNSSSRVPIRRMMDGQFKIAGWTRGRTGDPCWTKYKRVGESQVGLAVELQFSANSDFLAVSIYHLTRAITSGRVDVGVLLVQDDLLDSGLARHGPRMSEAKRYVTEASAQDLPLILISLAHDGAGPRLEKRAKNPKKISSESASKIKK